MPDAESRAIKKLFDEHCRRFPPVNGMAALRCSEHAGPRSFVAHSAGHGISQVQTLVPKFVVETIDKGLQAGFPG
jgi:hypothetical protein